MRGEASSNNGGSTEPLTLPPNTPLDATVKIYFENTLKYGRIY